MNRIFHITRCTPGDKEISVGITHDGERKAVTVDRAQFLRWLDMTDRLNYIVREQDEFETPTGRYPLDDYFMLCPTHIIVDHLYAFIVIHHREFAPYLNELANLNA